MKKIEFTITTNQQMSTQIHWFFNLNRAPNVTHQYTIVVTTKAFELKWTQQNLVTDRPMGK